MGSGSAFPFKQRRYNPPPQEVSDTSRSPPGVGPKFVTVSLLRLERSGQRRWGQRFPGSSMQLMADSQSRIPPLNAGDWGMASLASSTFLTRFDVAVELHSIIW